MSATLVAPLNLREKFAWGLRVKPTFEQVIQASKKRVKLPPLDRSAKWYGMSNYRAFILDQSKKYNDYEHLKLDYDQSGARLPARAAAVSTTEVDDSRFEQSDWHDVLEDQRQLDEAMEAEEEDKRREAEEIRAHEMAHLVPVSSHWAIEANHEDLEEVGVDHPPLVVHVSVPHKPRPAALHQSETAGHLGALRSFPTFEELNLRQRNLNLMEWATLAAVTTPSVIMHWAFRCNNSLVG
jgi:hypothetical protein